MIRSGKRSSIQKYVKASIAVIQASRQTEDPVREREVLGIKSEEAQKAWHKLRYWSPTRIMNKFDPYPDEETLKKHGREWYECIKLCIEGVPSFKFKDYYNVIYLLWITDIITEAEAWETANLAFKVGRENSK